MHNAPHLARLLASSATYDPSSASYDATSATYDASSAPYDATAAKCSTSSYSQVTQPNLQQPVAKDPNSFGQRCPLCPLLRRTNDVVCTQGVKVYVRPQRLKLPGLFCLAAFLHCMHFNCSSLAVDAIYNCRHCLGTIVLQSPHVPVTYIYSSATKYFRNRHLL